MRPNLNWYSNKEQMVEEKNEIKKQFERSELQKEFIQFLFDNNYSRINFDEEKDLYIEFLENKIIGGKL